jgi:regulator of protease activity HflC (stomatin/prohibitin superfamily)
MNIASLVSTFAVFLWVGFVVVLILVVVAAWRGRPIKKGALIILVIGAVAIATSLLSAGLVWVNPEERGMVISALSPEGYRPEALNPGLSFIIPFAENVVLYPISKQTYTMSIAPNEGQIIGDDSISARTSDGQEVLVDASVIYQISPEKIPQIHIQWQNRYSDDLVRPVTRGVIRDAISQFSVQEVYSTKRAEVSEMITTNLIDQFQMNGLDMIDFVLRNIQFSPEYAASVEQKQIAEQQAQQAAFVVQQRQQEAQQAREVAKGQADAAVTVAEGNAKSRIINAEAEAKALELIQQALQDNPELLTYQYITKLAPNIQAMLLPSNSPFIMNLPSMGLTGETGQ